MKKIYLIMMLLVAIIYVNATDVTIQVDMNGVNDLYEGGSVWVYMDADWNEYYTMTDENADGIYEYVITKDTGSEFTYRFSYQYGADEWSEYYEESVSGNCANENGFRYLTIPDENVILPAVKYESCFEAGITFQIDMSDVTDLYEGGAVWIYTVDWAEYYYMEEAANNIYYFTLPLTEGDTFYYKFSYQYGADEWSEYYEETVPASCAAENGYREFLVPAGDSVLAAVAYANCVDTGDDEPVIFTTTFNVDMNDLAISDLYEGGSVWLNINSWESYYEMEDLENDGIYSYEFEQVSGTTVTYDFAYQTGPDADWDYIEEEVPVSCANESGLREYKALGDSIMPEVVFGACGEIGTEGTEKVTVTFNVELGGDSVLTNGLWMVTKGPWSWRELTHNENDVYTGTIRLFAGQNFPYTFVYGGKDNWAGEETVPEDCNFGTAEAPERLFEGAMVDSVMPLIAFGKCAGDTTSILSERETIFSVYPNPTSDKFKVKLESEGMLSHLTLFDITGKMVWIKQNNRDIETEVSVEDLNPGIYILKVNSNHNSSSLKIVIGK